MPASNTDYRALHSGIASEMEMLFAGENVGLKLEHVGSCVSLQQRNPCETCLDFPRAAQGRQGRIPELRVQGPEIDLGFAMSFQGVPSPP